MDEDSSSDSAVSENGEFSKLNLGQNNNSEENNDNIINNNIIDDENDKKTYRSMFSFSMISKNGDFDSNPNENKTKSKNKNLDIRVSDINNNNKISIWEKIKQQISNFKNQLIFNYNIFSGLNNLKLDAPGLPKEIQIFDEKYSKQDDKLINRLKNIPWFSYRKDFNQIKEKKAIYTSDAGWGCMLRASQMILAQGLYRLYSIKDLETFINEFIAYFYDNKIPIKFIRKSKDDIKDDLKNNDNIINSNKENIDKKKDEELFDDFLIIDATKECRMSFIDISMEMIKGLENMSERKSDQKYIISPFSIRNYIKVQKEINAKGKKVGEWFSNYDVIKLITEISVQMNENNDNDFKIINFSDGAIYVEDIINTCFKEEDVKIDIDGFENISYSTFEKSEIRFNENNINHDLKSNIYVFNKRRFKFADKFIIFVSVRHGLYHLDEEIFEDILNVFDIPSNIGLIGGKNSRAFYFIGKCSNNLLFLDPHYVQSTIPLSAFGTYSIQDTYRPNDIYYMPINELSPSFTIGFAIKDMKSFKIFMDNITSPDYFIDQKKHKTMISKKINLFIVKNWHLPVLEDDDSNQDISNNVDIKEDFF